MNIVGGLCNRSCIMPLFLLGEIAVMADVSAAGKEKRPNVIIVMTDDQGYGELSVHGNPILKTPHMDRLHDQSIRLADFHAAPMSTATRGQLITGLDALHNGAVNVSSGRTMLRRGIPTIADYFKQAGYHTAIFGKWHLGDTYPYRPEDRGFEETLWFPSSHIGSVPDYWGNDYFDDVYIHNGQRKQMSGYCTEVFFHEAMKWIEKCADTDSPFVACLMPNAPHGPFNVSESYVQRIRERITSTKLTGISASRVEALILYLAMIENLDENLGYLMDFLDRKGIAENTILIFMTDNGSVFAPYYPNPTMRGKKAQLYEGGHRVPFFIRWPGKLDSSRDIEGLAEVQDVLPTLLDLCGIKYQRKNFDGVSLAGVLYGKTEIPGDRMLFINYSRMPTAFTYPSPYGSAEIRPRETAVLWKRWRLLNDTELYDLASDPLQQNNVINDFPEVRAHMKEGRARWWKKIGGEANVSERSIIGDDHENSVLLTCCEWKDVFVDQQTQVKKGTRRNGYWLLEVARTGRYVFELQRWPREADLPLCEAMPSGKAYDITGGRMFITTQYGNVNMKKVVTKNDKSVRFECRLEKGPVVLHTWFEDADKEPLFGAYYVYVTRKPD